MTNDDHDGWLEEQIRDPGTGRMYSRRVRGAGKDREATAAAELDDDGAVLHAERVCLAAGQLYAEFPFVSEAARSVVLAAILTGAIRRSLATSPFFALVAPTPGTGKGQLADTISIISTGRSPAAIGLGRDDEEVEKRLLTLLRAGDAVISIDNIDRPLRSHFLCSMATQEYVQGRILGKSERYEAKSSVLVLLNGNNIQMAADIARRTLICRIDAEMERPDTRQFDFNPREVARERFPELVVAALTVLRAYDVAGRPCSLEALGSFEEWNAVREALVWLDQADPADTRVSHFDTDPEIDGLDDLLRTWRACFGSRPVTVVEIGEHCKSVDASQDERHLYDLLQELARERPWNGRKIGWMLHRFQGRVVGGFALRSLGQRSQGQLWQVVPPDAPQPPE